MKKFFKENIAVVIAFALPILLIAVVAVSVYLPSVFLSTDYNFVYAVCSDGTRDYYRCNDYLEERYLVKDGKLVVNSVRLEDIFGDERIPTPVSRTNYSSRIFLHDTETNESREISLEEAQLLTLSNLLTSPDGVSVSSHYDRSGGFFPFFDGGSSYGYYLTKGNSRSKLNLINDDNRYYYDNNFRFIGWVLPEEN